MSKRRTLEHPLGCFFNIRKVSVALKSGGQDVEAENYGFLEAMHRSVVYVIDSKAE